ncbi:uncharacterized protein LOC127786769 [Diospyros lotus]|uniref:uncharacterized protein LOC127786769 n=1 Tax=Diospyros lotus TaxID=55363 RepID=UPI00225ACB23|nr:uncharacterized protein LOC127786769 [Diospyros lotus]
MFARACLLHIDNEHENESPQSQDHEERDYPKMRKCLHKLDLYRKRLLKHENATPQLSSQGEGKNKRIGPKIVRPATELHEAGVRFMKSESKSLPDITFDGGVLKLPNFMIADFTESMFLNLIAFERCHIPVGNDISSFIALIDYIIDDSRAIKLLSSKGIIDNFIGSDKEASDLFNKISKECRFDLGGKLGHVHNKLIDYYNTRWHKWRANLTQTYFKSLWAIIFVIAAFFIFSCCSANYLHHPKLI